MRKTPDHVRGDNNQARCDSNMKCWVTMLRLHLINSISDYSYFFIHLTVIFHVQLKNYDAISNYRKFGNRKFCSCTNCSVYILLMQVDWWGSSPSNRPMSLETVLNSISNTNETVSEIQYQSTYFSCHP